MIADSHKTHILSSNNPEEGVKNQHLTSQHPQTTQDSQTLQAGVKAKEVELGIRKLKNHSGGFSAYWPIPTPLARKQ